ncbi:MAG: methyltransferase domain-containing protein [Clostridia bacterium]
MNEAYARFQAQAEVFQCPLCHQRMILDEKGSFHCAKGHCFDMARKGYVNFAPNQKQTQYDTALFAHRRAVFAAGCYAEVAHTLGQWVLRETTRRASFRVLDAGCGEGYYTDALAQNDAMAAKGHLFGVDLAKEAIQLATGYSSPAHWLVGNLANLPFSEGSFDVVLDVLTPANYEEFFRVLRPDGVLIKVVPGSDYLREIRDQVAEQLVHKQYANDRVIDYLEQNAQVLERKTLRYTCPVTSALWSHFLQMTPMTTQVALTDALAPDAVTIHMEVIKARRRRIRSPRSAQSAR